MSPCNIFLIPGHNTRSPDSRMPPDITHIFSPECLTISLGNHCNLDCLYCFAQKEQISKKTLPESEFTRCIEKAGELVARNCFAKNIPFYFGFQGSGEPLLYFEKCKRIFNRIQFVAEKYHVKLFSFITSNGCMQDECYEWVAQNFDRICLSLDGDRESNDRHRLTKNGLGTYHRIVSAIGLFQKKSKNCVIRMTVTRYNVHKLVPIVLHFIKDLGVSDIQVEPVYFNRSLAPSPRQFAEQYLDAKHHAQNIGVVLNYSGCRKHKKHGPYCNMDRNVLYIGPLGTASVCLFKDYEEKTSPFSIGFYHAGQDLFVLDNNKIDRLIEKFNQPIPACNGCELTEYCVKGCPDLCVLDAGAHSKVKNTIRCQINRLLYEYEC